MLGYIISSAYEKKKRGKVHFGDRNANTRDAMFILIVRINIEGITACGLL